MSSTNNNAGHFPEKFALLQKQFHSSIERGDPKDAAQLIDELLAGQRSLREIYLEIIAPALVSIGDSWCSGEIGVGVEHLATQIVMQQMDRLRSLFSAEDGQSPYRVLVACVEGEEHFVGARMLADLCLLKGWAVDFLGANTPGSAIVDMAKNRHSQLVALSLTMDAGMDRLPGLLDDLAKLSPAPHMVLGGQLFSENTASVTLHRGCVIARDAAEGVDLIHKLLRADRPKSVLKEYLLGLGRRVRELRTKKGWTQEELAQAARVTRVCIVAVEGGKQNLSMDILVRLANALAVAPENLLASNRDSSGLPGRDA